MIRIREIILPAEHDQTALLYCAAQALRIKPSDITSLQIFRRSIDARKKPDLKWVYTVDVTLKMSEKRLMKGNRNRKITLEEPYYYRIEKKTSEERPVIVGFGPAGMFAALVLAKAGLRPIILERGATAPERQEKVEAFWNGGKLDPESNVQFGEGGAGTFSDGKLNTGTKNVRSRWVLEQLVHFGASEEILYDAKPHVGTDVLFTVVQNLRNRVIKLGGEVRFGAKMTELIFDNGQLSGISYVQNGIEERLACKHLILAIGHSARDTFRQLHEQGITMEPKPFSMGVRIEHKQSMIDLSQYGSKRPKGIPPADYKLSVHLPDGSSAYTFCMCPGGYVVAAASQEGGVVTNGMSYSDRDGEMANSALLVTLKPEDFPDQSTLGGMYWQEEMEQKAFLLGGGNYCAPAQKVGDFLQHRPSVSVDGTYRPGLTPCNLHELYPEKITKTLEQAIIALEENLTGFSDPEAVLTAPETRSSSPVRIVRGENCQGSIRGLYPCGEGAGYAGGIMSAAVDGMICAEALIKQI
ncbi:MAG: hypothetical protein E7434_08015 [Ruminococcaceae bacterium]|nr:hypothetical protein [Oscillospiraceae bacterium]